MNSIRLNFLRSYILSGRLLHAITILEIGLIFFLIPLILEIPSDGFDLNFILKVYLSAYLISLPVFSQLDARSRFQNYKQIKDQIQAYGYDERILQPVLKSRCQRDAAWVAAKELGYGKACMQYYARFGYRWYNVFPDFVLKKPQFVFTSYFWKTTFFTPTYKPKFKYSVNKGNNINIVYTKIELDA